MKIIIATPILYDSTSPFNHLLKDILCGFLDAGHKVVRIVATDDLANTDYKMGIEDIHYIPVLRKRREKANIIMRYLSDTFTNIKMARMIKSVKADVLFEDVSYSSYWAVKKAKKLKMRVVAMLQDVWPDNAVQSHLIAEKSLLYKFFELWQKPVYHKSDRLICISDDMKEFIASKGVSKNKIEVIYNWGYSDEPVNIPWEENLFVKKYDLFPEKFYAVYAGNIGRMQNVQLIVKAAKLLTEKKDVQFLIVGDGVMCEEIEKMTVGMSNVTMLPLQPSELATSIYSMAGVNIVPLVPGGLKTALPSKVGVCLSCGNPIIACVDKGSRFEEMLTEYMAGCVVSSNDEEELAEAILQYKENGQEKNYGCFRKKFVREANVKKYAEAIC